MESTEEALPERPGERSVARRSRSRKLRWWIAGIVAVVVLLGALFVGTALWTDRPEFCGTCHEMRPYVDAWAAGPHSNVWCVDCHVGKSYSARFAHKFTALGEVVAHFSGKTRLPMNTPPQIADADCVVCHATVTPKLKASGFNHNEHESKAACQACHAETGHAVTQTALTAVGVFNPGVRLAVVGGGTATVGHGSANVANHVSIACTRCHDLKKTGCSACHAVTAKHFRPALSPLPECTLCHKAGPKWTFTHPAKGECQTCHTVSAKHFKPAVGPLGACTQCHQDIGKSWAFTHPQPPVDCTTCHAIPAQHFQPATGSLKPCSQCHAQAGVSWKFSHPGSSADCASCHAAPAGHSAGQCSQCHHKTGVSFAFVHPSTGAPHGIGGRPCAACHPNGYTTHSCTCHG
ncbi:MAG: NapC/NirT family cytochrome c [Coriobacteriia bacterium]|nr:NapC/NirT family cytochrome c [Coriobacteriia bacterium]